MPGRLRFDWHLVWLLYLIANIQMLTMPKFLYPGDPFASRAEASDLLATRSLGIDYSQRESLADLVTDRGQYLFENDSQKKFYSKYGFANMLFYLPPLLVEWLWTGSPPSLLHNTQSFVFILNVYQILFALITACYLYRTAGLYTTRRGLQALFVLVSIYSTFLWHYLRAPTHEVVQIWAMVGFYYHSLVFIRRSTDENREWRHLLFAALYVGVLLSLKLSYALLLLPLWSLPFFSRSMVECSAKRATTRNVVTLDFWERLWAYRRRYLPYLATPTALFAVFVLVMNYLRYGSPFTTAYDQWLNDQGQPYAHFTASALIESFPALTYKTGNANTFIHYPPWLFAVLALPGFWRLYKQETYFTLLTFLPSFFTLCCLNVWRGEWCYGLCYYYLPFLMIASFPSLILVQQAAKAIKSWGAVMLAAILVISAVSARLQVNVIATHYFLFHYTSSYFGQTGLDSIATYFHDCPHRALVHSDVLAHRYHNRTFPPIREIETRLEPSETAARQNMRAFVEYQASLNLYWLSAE